VRSYGWGIEASIIERRLARELAQGNEDVLLNCVERDEIQDADLSFSEGK